MSDLVLLVESGSRGAARAIARVRSALEGGDSVALVAQGNHDRAVSAVGSEAPSTPSIILTTSGTTGMPRAVELPLAALRASAELAESRLGGAGLWLTAIPVTGAGGLNTVVRSLLHGVEPTVWDGIAGAAHFDGESILTSLRDARARARALGLRCYTSFVPTQIERLISGAADASAALSELSAFDAVLLGADALGDATYDRLRTLGINVVTTYGATETCGGCVYDGLPFTGVDVSCIDGEFGRIVISGPVVAHRYRDGDNTTLVGSRWISNDLGVIRNGRLNVIGRTDDLIKVGGSTIALPVITEHLRTSAHVQDVIVLSKVDAEWGRIPVAYVVGGDVDDDVLRQLAATAAGRGSIPMDIVRLAALPLLPNGKVDRRSLLES